MSQAPVQRGFFTLLVIIAAVATGNSALAEDGGAARSAAGGTGVLARVGDSVEGAESSHGKDPRMWRLEADGPQGPMQVSAAAAADVGGGDRFDEMQNRALGRAYLADMYRRYGSWPDAVAAYNWGPGHMNGWIGSGRPFDKFPPAVAQYRTRVLVTSGLPADAPGAATAGPIRSRMTRLAMLRAQAKREMIALRRTSRGRDEVALLYTEIMRSTGPAVH
jgi:hypothetical protein